MACKSCSEKKGDNYKKLLALKTPPFNANDSMVYDPQSGHVQRLGEDDIDSNKHHLYLFFPEVFTPVCQSELGNLSKWIEEFEKLNVQVFGATTEPIHAVKDWFEQEESLKDSNYKIISSYLLVQRLGIMNVGKSKRANVFISDEGETIIQEYPLKVGRSISEIHRMIYAYTTDSYCAEGWENPSDGFLRNDGSKE